MHYGAPAGRVHEDELLVTADLPERSDSAVKIVQIRATAERDVLTIIDLLAVRKAVRGSAAAQERPLFEQLDP